MKILVADDSKTFRSLINASLTNLGHEVLLAEKGSEAIELYQKYHPDLVILDVMMEEMNGFDCARRIRAINTDNWIPIIFLSATVDDESISKGIEAGGDDYLTKPYSEVTLQAKIKAMQRIAEMRNRLCNAMGELRKITSIDVLTGVYNRFQFDLTLREKLAFANRHNHLIALLFIDLDHFKNINDTLGHEYGDLLLKEVALRIKSITRKDDFIARLGGDEFVIITTEIKSAKEAGDLAQKLVDDLSRQYIIRGNPLKIGASIGIAIYPSENITETTVIRCADMAMYIAKKMGRNNYKYYTNVISKQYKKQQGMEHELRFAIDRNEIIIYYQPIYDLFTKKIIKVEALVRWRHAEYGLVSPEVFIPLAEDVGLISELGLWIMKEACQQMVDVIVKDDLNVKLALNVSIRQFINENFVENVLNTLKEAHFPPDKFSIELTETTVITYSNTFKDAVKKLNEAGIEITIDDFGVKNSSFKSLKYLPIGALKIDKNFVKNVNNKEKNAIIVKSLITLADSLNIDAIAEGIQNEDELNFLIRNECRYGQGFYLSKPVLRDAIVRKIEEHGLTNEYQSIGK